MSAQREIPTPRITARAEGHFAICPVCEVESKVKVTEKKDPSGATFVLRREVNPDGTPGKVLEEVAATVTDYDLAAFEKHYLKEH